MPIRIARDLNLYLIMDNKHMKRIDVDYNVRVGYWASRNDMQETKSMSLWYESSIRILRTTCDKFLETIWGQPNQQTATIGFIYYVEQNFY
jgi:hypothetical protein